MTLDLDELCADLAEFSTVMGRLGIPCRVTFDVSGVPIQVREVHDPVQVPQDHTIKREVRSPDPVTPDKKAAATPSPAPKKGSHKFKTSDKTMKCPYCPAVVNTYGMHKHVRSRHPDQYDKEKIKKFIKGTLVITGQDADPPAVTIQGIDQDLLQAIPEKRPRTRSDPKELAPGDDFREGVHVKTTQMFEGILSGTIGTVRKRLGKNYEVSFGRPGYRTISRDFLVSV
jgi:hypothetical protein